MINKLGCHETYTNWIENNYPTKEGCINKCNEAVRSMTEYFTDLTVQVGYANGVYHCWCKDENGLIVDPTKKQFSGYIDYTLIADRFLKRHEIEESTGAIFLDKHGNDFEISLTASSDSINFFNNTFKDHTFLSKKTKPCDNKLK